MPETLSTTITATPCSLLRRLGCMLYDLVATLAIVMVLTMIAVALRGGTAVAEGNSMFQLVLLIAHWLYFAYCWRFGRQTLGMRAWKVHLASSETQISWRTTLIRYATAWLSLLALGAGFWLAQWHTAQMAWHDRLSGTWLEHRC